MSRHSYSSNFVPKQSTSSEICHETHKERILHQNSQIHHKYVSKFILQGFCTKIVYSFRNMSTSSYSTSFVPKQSNPSEMSQNSYSKNFVPKQSNPSELCHETHKVQILYQNSQIIQKYISKFIQYEFCTEIG